MIIISCCNNKGGVGKTSCVLNLAYALSLKKKVLMIDLDSQRNLSIYLNAEQNTGTIYEVITSKFKIESVICAIGKNLDLITSSVELTTLTDKFNLKHLLDGLDYDYIIIDTPPNFGLLTLTSIASSNYVIAPCEPEYLAYKGLETLRHTITSLNNKNVTVSLLGVLITKCENTLHHREVSQKIREEYPTFKAVIKKSIKYSDACLAEKSIIEYAPGFEGSKAYLDLAKEVESYAKKNRAI